ncbi:MAG: phage tail protein [Kineosporiaceae bacterium]
MSGGPPGATATAPVPLLRHLPAVMARDPFLAGFVGILEEMFGSVRAGVDGIEHHVDLNLADAQMLRWLAGWIGLVVDPAAPPAQAREAIRAAAEGLGLRGTRAGLEAHLRAVTGLWVRVDDSGGVYLPGERVPSGPPTVVIEVPRGGHLSREQIVACAMEEVPVGATVVVRHPDEPEPDLRGGAA